MGVNSDGGQDEAPGRLREEEGPERVRGHSFADFGTVRHERQDVAARDRPELPVLFERNVAEQRNLR